MLTVADQYGLLYEGGGRIEHLRNYLISVIAAAMICAIVTRLVGEKGSVGTLTKLVAGLFLSFTLIKPIASLEFSNLMGWTDEYEHNAAGMVADGENLRSKALSELIKQQTEEYILDKAQALDASLEVEVTLTQDEIPIPVKVRLSGKVSPYAKGRLQDIIKQDLGIEKENQVWT